MYFKFDSAASTCDEIIRLMSKLEEYEEELEACGDYINYALLYTEFSRYNFFKNNYEEVSTHV